MDGDEPVEVRSGLPENGVGLAHKAARNRGVQPAGLLLLPRKRAARQGQHVRAPYVMV
jgi:hypothetical protein